MKLTHIGTINNRTKNPPKALALKEMLGLVRLLQFPPYSTEWYSLIDIIQFSQHHWTSLSHEVSHSPQKMVQPPRYYPSFPT